MSISAHPDLELRTQYKEGLCSAGAALAVATHMALCPQCAKTSAGSWGGRNLPDILAADHGDNGEAYSDVLGPLALDDWRELDGGVRFAALKGVASLGEAVFLMEIAAGASVSFPEKVLFAVVLQGGLAAGAVCFARGDFADFAAVSLTPQATDGSPNCICLITCETA
jgi:anti-sigma factor ChrR (cupin superfamily)